MSAKSKIHTQVQIFGFAKVYIHVNIATLVTNACCDFMKQRLIDVQPKQTHSSHQSVKERWLPACDITIRDERN